MDKKIMPKKLNGTVMLPCSKSIAHRAIIAASMAKGDSIIQNITYSADVMATTNAMIAMGGNIQSYGSKLIINGAKTFRSKEYAINCGESGSTLRFLMPVSMTRQATAYFAGSKQLSKRPINPYLDIFDKQGIKHSSGDTVLDLTIKGQLKPDYFEIAGDISSQFITGLMFALPTLNGNSRIKIVGRCESKPYIDMTLKILEKYNIIVVDNNDNSYSIKGNQRFKPYDLTLEGDYSQAAFFFSANALGSNVECLGLSKDSLQGDKICIDILDSLKSKNNVEIDAGQCPDIIPVIAVVAALRDGETLIKNAKRLRLKESDRVNAMTMELNLLGANITQTEDTMLIKGVPKLSGGEVYSHGDHRIAMSLAIAATVAKSPVIIKDAQVVDKSYPNFWRDFEKLGGQYE